MADGFLVCEEPEAIDGYRWHLEVIGGQVYAAHPLAEPMVFDRDCEAWQVIGLAAPALGTQHESFERA